MLLRGVDVLEERLRGWSWRDRGFPAHAGLLAGRTEMAAIDRQAPDRADLIVRNAKVTTL
jgi:hypothetical protein